MITIPACTFEQANLQGLAVIVRIDGNVSVDSNGVIDDDTRLRAVLPTLERIKQKGGKPVIITHWSDAETIDPSLSTKRLVPWFEQHGFAHTVFAADIQAGQQAKTTPCDLVMFENIRFFKEELTPTESFAKQLATLGDYFIQDAFGALHRDQTSITLLPLQFEPARRSIGLLVQKELIHLLPLVENPAQPFVVLIGGLKVATKLPLLRALLPRIKTLLIAPPLCFTFLKALNKPIGKSTYEEKMVDEAGLLLEEAESQYIRVLLPDDFLATDSSFEHPDDCYAVTTLSDQEVGLSIGPRTTDHWSTLVHAARTVFCNGLPGNKEYPETLSTIRRLLEAFPHGQRCVIAGGDTNTLIKKLHVPIEGFLSTGGGSTLAFLSDQRLPGLVPFL